MDLLYYFIAVIDNFEQISNIALEILSISFNKSTPYWGWHRSYGLQIFDLFFGLGISNAVASEASAIASFFPYDVVHFCGKKVIVEVLNLNSAFNFLKLYWMNSIC